MELYEQRDRRRNRDTAAALTTLGVLWIPVPKPLPLRQTVRDALLNALAYTGGLQTEAARLLGISPKTLCFQLVNYDIPASGINNALPSMRLRARGSPSVPTVRSAKVSTPLKQQRAADVRRKQVS
jgi:regulatory Fis family protein